MPSHGITWDGMGWDGMGRDEKFTKSSHPMGRKIFKSIPSHDGTEILRYVPSHGTTRKILSHGTIFFVPSHAEPWYLVSVFG